MTHVSNSGTSGSFCGTNGRLWHKWSVVTDISDSGTLSNCGTSGFL